MARRELIEHRGRLIADVADRRRRGLAQVGVLVGQAAKVDLQGADVGQRGQGQCRLEARLGRLGRRDQRGDRLAIAECAGRGDRAVADLDRRVGCEQGRTARITSSRDGCLLVLDDRDQGIDRGRLDRRRRRLERFAAAA